MIRHQNIVAARRIEDFIRDFVRHKNAIGRGVFVADEQADAIPFFDARKRKFGIKGA